MKPANYSSEQEPLIANAEQRYLLDLILRRAPHSPQPEFELTPQSWPIKIYTLGRFSIERKEQPFSLPGRGKRKPLEMLRALIAFGGREVSQELIGEALWPDAEGDATQRSFDTTLHRLRKLINDDRAITLQEGRLSINGQLCWVDAWAFERLQGRIESILDNVSAHRIEPDLMGHLSDSVLTLYKGHFLQNDSEESWSIAFRERLRSKFVRLLRKTGLHWERIGRWHKATDCYQRGLELDSLIEEFYQRLMVCYQQQGLRAEALTVYQRCHDNLGRVLGINPSAKTEQLRAALLDS